MLYKSPKRPLNINTMSINHIQGIIKSLRHKDPEFVLKNTKQELKELRKELRMISEHERRLASMATSMIQFINSKIGF